MTAARPPSGTTKGRPPAGTTKGRPLKVGLVQLSMSADAGDNLARAIAGVREAAQHGAQVVVLPELFRSRYFCQSEDAAQFALAEAVPGPSTEALGALAKELKIALVASLFEKRAAGLYHNTAAVLDTDGAYLGKYRKMHIPDDPRYYEKYYFTPGDLGFKVFNTRPAQLGVLVCWDQWYPEAARLTAMQGAELLIYPTAIGWHPEEKAQYGERQHGAWETVQRGHAVANGCFVVAVNRTGFEPDPSGSGGIEFWGQSFIAGPDGRVLVRAPMDREAVIVETIDLAEIDAVRAGWPFFRDRRIDAYSEITRRFGNE